MIVDIEVQVGKCGQNPSKTEGFKGDMCEATTIFVNGKHEIYDFHMWQARNTVRVGHFRVENAWDGAPQKGPLSILDNPYSTLTLFLKCEKATTRNYRKGWSF